MSVLLDRDGKNDIMVVWRIRSAPIRKMSPERSLSTTLASTAICVAKLRRRCLRKTTITPSFIANQRLPSRRTEQLWLWSLVPQDRLEHAAKSTLGQPRPHIRNRSRRTSTFVASHPPIPTEQRLILFCVRRETS